MIQQIVLNISLKEIYHYHNLKLNFIVKFIKDLRLPSFDDHSIRFEKLDAYKSFKNMT